MSKEKKKKDLLFNIILLTVFFNIWFPKAGIKIGEIPLTVGNVFFALAFVVWIYTKIKTKKIYSFKIGSVIILGILYFVFKYIIVYAVNGTIKGSIGFIIPLIIYPIIFFIISDYVDTQEKMDKIVKLIVYGFFFLSAYSIIQYIVGIEGCCIPGLTVNYSDYLKYGSTWYMVKSNGTVAESTKIVSTYQNGNLYGVNTLLIYLLIYNYLKNKKSKALMPSLILFIVCVFLSLSRACWLGIILFIFMEILLENEKTMKSMYRKIFTVMMCLIMIILVFKYVPSIANRFFKTDMDDWVSMSGRTEGLQAVIKSVSESDTVIGLIIGPYGVSNYSGLAYEMFPLSVFVQTGIIGMIMLYYLFFKAVREMNKNNYIQKAVRRAVIIWLIVGIIECGYWLPPAALNMFIIIGLGYSSKMIENRSVEDFE